MVPNYSFHGKDTQVRKGHFGWLDVGQHCEGRKSCSGFCNHLEPDFDKHVESWTNLSTWLEWSPLIFHKPHTGSFWPWAASLISRCPSTDGIWASTVLPWPRVLQQKCFVYVCARKQSTVLNNTPAHPSAQSPACWDVTCQQLVRTISQVQGNLLIYLKSIFENQ